VSLLKELDRIDLFSSAHAQGYQGVVPPGT